MAGGLGGAGGGALAVPGWARCTQVCWPPDPTCCGCCSWRANSAWSPCVPESHVALGFSSAYWAYIPLHWAIFFGSFILLLPFYFETFQLYRKFHRGIFQGKMI